MTVRFLGGYGENYDRCVAECTHTKFPELESGF